MRGTTSVLAAIAGLLLSGCGEKHHTTTVAVDRPELAGAVHLTVTTPAIGTNGALQAEFTQAGAKTMPRISWSGVPAGAQEIEILIEDPDAPGEVPFVHLLVEGVLPGPSEYPGTSGVMASNTEGRAEYSPPNPPPGAIHHYHFEVLAVDKRFDGEPLSRDDLLAKMAKHVLASGQAVGAFGG